MLRGVEQKLAGVIIVMVNQQGKKSYQIIVLFLSRDIFARYRFCCSCD